MPPPDQTILGRPVNSQLVDAPSIRSESTYVDKDKETSDSNDKPGWNMPNESNVAEQEATRIHANLANSCYQEAAKALAK
jgi:hypothetical protein